MWLTIPEAARYARKRRETFEALIKSGAIFAIEESGRRLVHTDDIDRYYRQFPYRTRPTEARRIARN